MATTGPLVAIVGETASGKSALAIDIAEQFNGEIICADSRTVYRGLDIGTAKPSLEDQRRVPHHLLNVVEPDEPFTAADFKRLAEQAIADITARGKLPILVGGSGLYVDAVLFDYGFSDSFTKRDPQNPRHLDKAAARPRKGLRAQTLILGLSVPRDQLRERIEARVEHMVQSGFVQEVERLRRDYPDSKALLAPGYKAFAEYLDGRLGLREAKAAFVRNDMQLAKRQRTWFKRNQDIQWCENPEQALQKVEHFLHSSLLQ